MSSTAMPPALLDAVAERFKVLAEPARLRILERLRHGRLHVNALVEATGLQQANLSRHLQTLYTHGLVVRVREGTFIYYGIADPQVFALCDLVCGQVEKAARTRATRVRRRAS
jgi:DNA-binding transcriptional ArsR family regulator